MKNLAFIRPTFRVFLSAVNPFWWHLCHFLTLSLFGFLALKITKTRTSATSSPNSLDIFFTSVSATTVSSMSAVEMEVFSNAQLIIITILMFLGGEVFVSLLEFQLSRRFPVPKQKHSDENTTTTSSISHSINSAAISGLELESGMTQTDHRSDLKSKSLWSLGHVILGYLLAVNIFGSILVSLYITLAPHAKHVLESKGLKLLTFSLFTTVSTFTNCGFIPTNENMIVFKNSSGLLLLLISQILLGNCLYPPCLRSVIWVMEKLTGKEEFRYILNNYSEMGYSHLLSGLRCGFLVITAVGFLVLQLIIFCSLEWNSEAGIWDGGLNWYQKLVASLFQVTNSRHAGESVVDISVISPAILVVFVVMMYLPPYTTFYPSTMRNKEMGLIPNGKEEKGKREPSLMRILTFSQLSYLAIFIILICITERQKLKDDPLNFTVLNITLEVISAYGNVGFSTGYSCKRQLKPDSSCEDAWYGFAGRWSGKGKFILILVMFFGRMKQFNIRGGRAWKLS